VADDESFEEALKTLREQGDLEEIRDFDSGTRSFRMTEKGMEKTESMIRSDPAMALQTFSMLYNKRFANIEDPMKRILKCAQEMRDQFGVNLLRLLEKHGEKLEGLSISDDIPEDLKEKYDGGPTDN